MLVNPYWFGGVAPVTFTDNFTRANANPMSNPGVGTWSNGSANLGNLRISGNLCAGTGAVTCCARVATPVFGAVQRAKLTIYDTGVSRQVRVRMQSAADASGYAWQISNDNVSLGMYKFDDTGGGGTYTLLGAISTLGAAVATGDTIEVLVDALNNLYGYYNGILKVTTSNGVYSGGAPGLQMYGPFQFGSLFVATDS